MARKLYSIAKKKAIVGFALSKGRGGISLAMKKYGVSFGALKAWMGGKNPAKTRIAAKPPKLDGRKARRIKSAIKLAKSLEKQAKGLLKALKGLG